MVHCRSPLLNYMKTVALVVYHLVFIQGSGEDFVGGLEDALRQLEEVIEFN